MSREISRGMSRGMLIERSCRVTPVRCRSRCNPLFWLSRLVKNQIFSLHFETFFWNRHYNRGTTRRCFRIQASSAQETVRSQQLQHRKLTHFLSWQNFSNTAQLVPRFGSRCDYICCELRKQGNNRKLHRQV